MRDKALLAIKDEVRQGRLQTNDVADVVVTDQYRSQHNGVNHVYLRQRLNKLDVINGVANINMDDSGAVLSLHQQFSTRIQSRVPTATPTLNSAEALAALAREKNIPLLLPPLPKTSGQQQENRPDQFQQLTGGSLSQDDIPLRLVYIQQEETLHLAWDIVIRPYNSNDWWHAWIDAHDGTLLHAVNWTADASYRVFALPKESPLDGPRTLEIDIEDPTASPFGWHDTDGAVGAEFTDTRGNNVFAQEDSDANNNGGRRPEGGAGLVFDFPLDLSTQQPAEYEDFAIANLFYWNNVIHDVLYHYGFNESAGNFQQNNYGNGGQASDPVLADAQDGSSTNNANFSTPPDGGSGRMQMFVFTPPAVVQVNSPANIAGNYRVNPASFGAALTLAGVTSDISLVDDGSANPSQGCNALVGFTSGNLALIDRGGCEFGVKALNAENVGASGVIVVNNEAGNGTISMGAGAVGNQVTIPSVMVGNNNGGIIRAELSAGVNATLKLDALSEINRDSDLDAGVMVHEYGHGVSNRLTGGPSNASCLFGSQQAGEGWSDFLALVFTAAATDTAGTPRGMGRYVIFRENDPLAGIRPAPYSRDMSINPLVYSDIITAGQAGSPISVPHGVGTVWATALWDMYWNLVDKFGFDPDLINGAGGNQLALQLVMDGMKMQPCGPTFITARDAILLADQTNNGGANQCDIWQAFARRGMGVSANDGGNSQTLNVTAAFDQPEACTTDIILADSFETP